MSDESRSQTTRAHVLIVPPAPHKKTPQGTAVPRVWLTSSENPFQARQMIAAAAAIDEDETPDAS